MQFPFKICHLFEYFLIIKLLFWKSRKRSQIENQTNVRFRASGFEWKKNSMFDYWYAWNSNCPSRYATVKLKHTLTYSWRARTHSFENWNKVYFLRPFEIQFPFDACVWVESYYFNTTSDEEIHHRLNRNKFNLNELISLSIGCVVVCEWKEREWKSNRLELLRFALLCFWNGMVVCYLNTHKFQIYL